MPVMVRERRRAPTASGGRSWVTSKRSMVSPMIPAQAEGNALVTQRLADRRRRLHQRVRLAGFQRAPGSVHQEKGGTAPPGRPVPVPGGSPVWRSASSESGSGCPPAHIPGFDRPRFCPVRVCPERTLTIFRIGRGGFQGNRHRKGTRHDQDSLCDGSGNGNRAADPKSPKATPAPHGIPGSPHQGLSRVMAFSPVNRIRLFTASPATVFSTANRTLIGPVGIQPRYGANSGKRASLFRNRRGLHAQGHLSSGQPCNAPGNQGEYHSSPARRRSPPGGQ